MAKLEMRGRGAILENLLGLVRWEMVRKYDRDQLFLPKLWLTSRLRCGCLRSCFSIRLNDVIPFKRLEIPGPLNCGDATPYAASELIVGSNHDYAFNVVGFWPWMASLGYFNQTNDSNQEWTHTCGATLISHEHFLTAAHCTQNLEG